MRKVEVQQPQGLIRVLLDRSARDDERDDAAMDLWLYDDPQAEEALVKAATDPSTNPVVAETCAESLVTIWLRKNTFRGDVLSQLRGDALDLALNTLRTRRPEWKEQIEALAGVGGD